MNSLQFIRLEPPKKKGQAVQYKAPTVCGLTTLSRATIYRLIARGDFPAPATVSGRSLWRESDILAWVEAQKYAVRKVQGAAP